MKNSNDTIRNRTRNLPACSTVLQPTAPPRDPDCSISYFYKLRRNITKCAAGFKLEQSNSDCVGINPLNPELNPICYLLALLAHHFLHVSRVMIKSLTLRLLMSYIYGAHILDVSRSHKTTHHSRQDSSGRVISSSQRPVPDNARHLQQTNIHAPGGIRTHDLSR